MSQVSNDFRPGVRTANDLADYDAFLLRLGPRDKAAVERHVAVCEEEPTGDHANLWRRLACLMATLATKAVTTAGQRAVQFFAPDGKYRRQIFAMEDLRDGKVAVYVLDVLAAALAARELRGPIGKPLEDGGGSLYEIGGTTPPETIQIQVLTSANSMGAPDYYRHMVGWGRSVLKITLPATATAAQFRACQTLCLAAGRDADVDQCASDS